MASHRVIALVAALVGCGGQPPTMISRAFVAPARCGQGPFEIHQRMVGKGNKEGVEIVACTSRRLRGHVDLLVDDTLPLPSQTFGDEGVDNQRCVAAGEAMIAGGGAGGAGAASAAAGSTAAAAPSLREIPFDGREGWSEEVCRARGLEAQDLWATDFLSSPDGALFKPGSDLRIRIWSELPNDLDGVVFLVRHRLFNLTAAEAAAEVAEIDHSGAVPTPMAPPREEPPPPPRAESVPSQPVADAEWVPGYWARGPAGWAWLPGFWRVAQPTLGPGAPPPSQVETIGAAPLRGAIWIGGLWAWSGSAYVWIGGHWELGR